MFVKAGSRDRGDHGPMGLYEPSKESRLQNLERFFYEQGHYVQSWESGSMPRWRCLLALGVYRPQSYPDNIADSLGRFSSATTVVL